MPFNRIRRNLVLAAAATALGCAALAAAPASAGSVGDEVYADSHGNLVINSAAGYKRIIVGKGHLADEYAARGSREEPKVVRMEEDDGKLYLRHQRKCRRQGVLLHGRSYMYGLADDVVPVPVGRCR